MNRFRTHIVLFILAILAWGTGANQIANAQTSSKTLLGVSFNNEIAEQRVLDQIPELQRIGIRVIELQDPVSNSLINALAAQNFQIFVRSNLRFLTQSELVNEENISDFYQPFLERYTGNNNVRALGVYSYSQTEQTIVSSALDNAITDTSGFSLYQHHTRVHSTIPTIIAADAGKVQRGSYFFFDEQFSPNELEKFSSLIEQNVTLILADIEWLKSAQEESSLFARALVAFNEMDEFLYSNSATSHTQNWVPDWPIIFLLLLWLSLGLHILVVPPYRPLISRYFTFHRFFVDDVMRFRERSAVSGAFLLIQHAFLSGLMAYIFSKQAISELGLQALYYHLPYAAIFGKNYFSIFTFTVIVSFITKLICLIWIYLPSKSMKHFSQAINLYSWIFHLDFLIVSFALIKLITGTSPTLMSVLLALHLAIYIFAFLLATFDSSKYMLRGRLSYMVLTFAMYLILTLSLFISFVYSGYPYQIMKLALSL